MEATDSDRISTLSAKEVATFTRVWFSRYLKWDIDKMMAAQTGVEAQIRNLVQADFLTEKKGEELILIFQQGFVLVMKHLKSIRDARSVVQNRPIQTFSEWVDNMIFIRKEISDLEKTSLAQLKRYSNTKEGKEQQEKTLQTQYEQDLIEKQKMCLAEPDCLTSKACFPQKVSFFSSTTVCSPKKK
jgi:hypothetical protein